MSIPNYIIGHRNPDADAVCSAIAYAALKHAQGDTSWRPARCGNSNPRIDAVLNRFKVPLPLFLGDVTPRLRDIMVRDIHTVRAGNTAAEALELIDQHDIRLLPIVDSNRHLAGAISVFQLGQYFIPKPQETVAMRHVFGALDDIIRSLRAQVLNVVDGSRLEDLYVRVGAMDVRSFGKFTKDERTPTEETIVVVGDRWDIQQKSIQAGIRLLVVTGGLDVDEEVIDLAKEKEVSLIVSPFDTATTSWIIRTAHRLDRLLTPMSELETFGPEEKVSLVRRRVSNNNTPAYMVLDDDRRLVGVFTKSDILKPAPTRLILVDHNEMSQAVPGADQVEIAEIIDHHRLGNLPTQQPILFVNEPVGSTCTIVADLFRRNGLQPRSDIAGVLMSGIISDTLKLNSPTSTPKDAEILRSLAIQADVAIDDLAQLIFSSGSVILQNAPERVIRTDFKIYDEGEARYSVSQVEELGFDNFWSRTDTILEALEAVRQQEGLLFSALLVTDINTQNSLLAVQGSGDVIDIISYPSVERYDVFDMPGIVSRKKQLIPYLTTILQSLGVTA